MPINGSQGLAAMPAANGETPPAHSNAAASKDTSEVDFGAALGSMIAAMTPPAPASANKAPASASAGGLDNAASVSGSTTHKAAATPLSSGLLADSTAFAAPVSSTPAVSANSIIAAVAKGVANAAGAANATAATDPAPGSTAPVTLTVTAISSGASAAADEATTDALVAAAMKAAASATGGANATVSIDLPPVSTDLPRLATLSATPIGSGASATAGGWTTNSIIAAAVKFAASVAGGADATASTDPATASTALVTPLASATASSANDAAIAAVKIVPAAPNIAALRSNVPVAVTPVLGLRNGPPPTVNGASKQSSTNPGGVDAGGVDAAAPAQGRPADSTPATGATSGTTSTRINGAASKTNSTNKSSGDATDTAADAGASATTPGGAAKPAGTTPAQAGTAGPSIAPAASGLARQAKASAASRARDTGNGDANLPAETIGGTAGASGGANGPAPAPAAAAIRQVTEAPPAAATARVANLRVDLGQGNSAQATVRERGGAVEVKIVATTAQSAERIGNEVGGLRRSLDSAGLQLTHAEVSYQGQPGSERQRHEAPNGQPDRQDAKGGEIFTVNEVKP